MKTASGFFFVTKSLLKRTINFLTDYRLHSQPEIQKRPMLVTMKGTMRGLFDSRCWLIIAEYGTALQPARGSEEPLLLTMKGTFPFTVLIDNSWIGLMPLVM